MMAALRMGVLVLAVMCHGCFLDSLWSDHDDSNDPAADRQWTRDELIPEGQR